MEQEPLTLEDVAEALTAVMDTQDAIMRMLWSIRGGVPGAHFLDDSDFQSLAMRRRLASTKLTAKMFASRQKRQKP